MGAEHLDRGRAAAAPGGPGGGPATSTGTTAEPGEALGERQAGTEADLPAPRIPWLRETRRHSSIRERPDAHWWAVGSVCVGAFMGQLDASIVTLAFPDLERSFGAGLGAVTWVGLSYLLVLVGLVTAVGRLSDMLGRKLVYVYGFLVFIAGSALCGLAPSLGLLIAFRALQALGAAMLQANSVAIISLATPRRALGRALGYQGAAQALGLALGPSVGGLLLALGGWRLLFLVNVPFGLLGVAAGLLFIPRSRHLARWSGWSTFDWPGLGLFLPAVVALLAALSLAGSDGASPLVIGLAGAALLTGTGFVLWERRAPAPLVDLRLLSQRVMAAGLASGMLAFLVLFGVLLTVPFLLERGHGLSSGLAGAELMAMPLALGLTAPLAGRLADRLGARPLTVAGAGLVAVALAVAALVSPGPVALVVVLLGVGVGLGLFTAPNNASIMGSAPREQAATVSGLLNMTRGVGTALGLAVTGLVFDQAGGTSHLPASVENGFVVAAGLLAVLAAVAAGLSAVRGRSALGDVRVASLE